MNHADAKHADELYKAISVIDRRLEHLVAHHRFIAKVDTWASVPTGNYSIELEIPRGSPFQPMIRAALEGQLLHEREMRASGLRKLGFDVPEAPAITSHKGET